MSIELVQLGIFGFSAGGLLILAILARYKGKEEKPANLFFYSLLFAELWLISLGLYYYFQEPLLVLWLGRINFAVVLPMMYFLLRFSQNFPLDLEGSIFKILGNKILSLWILLFSILTLFTPLVSKEEVITGTLQRKTIYGDLYTIYIITYLTLLASIFFYLLRQFSSTKDKIQKSQVIYVLTGIVLSFLWGSITNVILPLFGIFDAQLFGPFAVIIFGFFVTVAIIKHQLFNIKVIATEIFTVVIIFSLFVNFLYSTSLIEAILNFILLISTSIFGVLLVKAVLKEVKAREELEKTDKAKTEFLSMASHQLRTPLTAIKGYVSLALEGYYGELNSKLKKALKNVAISTERLIRIVQDLLTISRIEMGKLELNLKPVDLANLAKSCLKELEFEAKKKNIDLIFKNPNQPLPKINLDSLKIRQAILNLIDNAIKYTNEGGKVEVSLDQERLKENHKERDYLKVIVKDTGVGFDPEEQSKLFESFSRGSAGIAKFVEGAGLGLNVAKRFVEIHQGFITAFSEGKNKGSTFTIYLPVGS